MSTQVQFRGGDSTQHSTFTGAEREVTVDTTDNTLVVHDGTTQGGHKLATAAQGALADTAVQPGDLGDAATGNYASQAEAEAGTAADKVMSPLLTAQAIAALASGGGSETLLAHELILERQKNTTITVTDVQSTTTATTGTTFNEWYDEGYGHYDGYPSAIGDTVQFYMYNWNYDWNDQQYTTNTVQYFWKAWQVGDIIEYAKDMSGSGIQPDLDNLTGTDFVYGRFLITSIQDLYPYQRLFTLEALDWNDNGYSSHDYFWWGGLSSSDGNSIRTNTETTEYSYTLDSIPANGTYSYLNTSNNAAAYMLSLDGLAYAEIANLTLSEISRIHWEPTQAFKDYKNDQTLEGKCISSTDDWTLEFIAYFPVEGSETSDPQSIYFQNSSASQTEFKWENLFSLGAFDGQLLDQFVEYGQGKWHHFAVAYNSASDTAYGYVDGVLKVTYNTASGINIFSNTNTLNAVLTNSEPSFHGRNPYLKGVRFTIGQNTPYIDGAATQAVPDGLDDITNVSQNLYTLCLYTGRNLIPVKGTPVDTNNSSLTLDIGQLIYSQYQKIGYCLTPVNQITFAGQNPITTTQNLNLTTNDVLEVPETTIGLYFGSADGDAFTYDLLRGQLTTPIEPPTVYEDGNSSIKNAGAGLIGSNSVVLGIDATSGSNCAAVGAYSTASGSYATAIGASTQATSSNSTALGYYARAQAYGGVALGASARADETYGIAIGNGAIAKYNCISLNSTSGFSDYANYERHVARIKTITRDHKAFWSSIALFNSGTLSGDYYVKRGSAATSYASSTTDYFNPLGLSSVGAYTSASLRGTCRVRAATSNGSFNSILIEFVMWKSAAHGTLNFSLQEISNVSEFYYDNDGNTFQITASLDCESSTGFIMPKVTFVNSYNVGSHTAHVSFDFDADISFY